MAQETNKKRIRLTSKQGMHPIVKPVQFSLSTLFLIVTVVAVAMSFATHWASSKTSQASIENVLQLVWFASFTISYWKSAETGWKRVSRAALITSEVWTLSIFATHLMILPIVNGIYVKVILLQATIISLVGVAITFSLAVTGWQLMRLSQTLWARGMKAVVFSAVSGMSVIALIAFSLMNDTSWQPRVVDKFDDDSNSFLHQKYNSNLQGRLTVSPNGSLIASMSDRELSIVDGKTIQKIVLFEAAWEAKFTSLTFLSGGSQLACLELSPEGQTILKRWNTTNWDQEIALPIADLAKIPNSGLIFPILAGDFLILVSVSDDKKAPVEIQIDTIDLSGDEWKISSFAKTTASLSKTIGKLPDEGQYLSKWYVSNDGKCIVSAAGFFEPENRWVFKRDAKRPQKIPTEILGHFSGSQDLLLGRESSRRIVWKRIGTSGKRLPFRDHLNIVEHSRVFVISCETGDRMLQSVWWQCQSPEPTHSRSHLISKYGQEYLIWDVEELP